MKCQIDGSCGLIIWNTVASCGSAWFHVWEWYVQPTVNCGLIWCQWWGHAISTPLMMVYFPALFLEFWYLSDCLEYLSSCLVYLSWTCCLICLWLISKFIMQVVMYRWRVNLSVVRWIVWRQWRRSLHCFLTWNSGPFWYSTASVVRTGKEVTPLSVNTRPILSRTHTRSRSPYVQARGQVKKKGVKAWKLYIKYFCVSPILIIFEGFVIMRIAEEVSITVCSSG